MKFLNIILSLIVVVTLSVKATPRCNGNISQTDSLIIKAKKLKQLYLLATSSSKETAWIYEKQFFDSFPSTFTQFQKLYGYEEHTAAILYDDAPDHILKLFNNINAVNDTVYYKKIISIAIGGHRDADAVNYFQNGLRVRIAAKPELTIYILNKLTDKDISSFWYFYFDEVHPPKQIPEALQKIKSLNPKIYNLMLNSRKQVMDYWDKD